MTQGKRGMSGEVAAGMRRELGERLGLGRALSAGELRDAAELRPAGVTAGQWLRTDDAGRVTMLMHEATPPEVCGPAVPVAPGGGPRVVERRVELVPGSTERFRDVGHLGRSGVRAADVFDRMRAEAARRGAAEPLSAGQVAVARRYRTLAEQFGAGGLRCLDLQRSGGGGGAGGVSEAQLAVAAELRAMRTRVGAGAALRAVRGGDARTVTLLRLVDLVCLQDLTLSQVLRRHRWAAKGTARKRLREALCGALDRMRCFAG